MEHFCIYGPLHMWFTCLDLLLLINNHACSNKRRRSVITGKGSLTLIVMV
jgi:hypothetical protein